MSAAEQLEAAVLALSRAVDRQQADPDPTHDDLYALTSQTNRALCQLGALLDVLAGQVAGDALRWILRDGRAGDPGRRLAATVAQLGAARALIGVRPRGQ